MPSYVVWAGSWRGTIRNPTSSRERVHGVMARTVYFTSKRCEIKKVPHYVLSLNYVAIRDTFICGKPSLRYTPHPPPTLICSHSQSHSLTPHSICCISHSSVSPKTQKFTGMGVMEIWRTCTRGLVPFYDESVVSVVECCKT
jgi:hypothetical protein